MVPHIRRKDSREPIPPRPLVSQQYLEEYPAVGARTERSPEMAEIDGAVVCGVHTWCEVLC